MSRVTVIGSLNMDLVARSSRLPLAGETLTATSFDTGAGGKGANQAIACARLSRQRGSLASLASFRSTRVKMIGAVGDDEFGQTLLAGLRQDRIDNSEVVIRPNTRTGVASIWVETVSGENHILISPNANHTLTSDMFTDFSFIQPSISPPDLILLQLEIPLETVLQILQTAKRRRIAVVFNPAPAPTQPLPDQAYEAVTHLIMNETEAAALSGRPIHHRLQTEPEMRDVAQTLLDRGVRHVVITLGSRGAFYATDSVGRSHGLVPACGNIKVVDTTGAGDTFVGAYALRVATKLSALSSSSSSSSEGHASGDFSHVEIRSAVEWANQAAAKAVSRPGAQSSIPFLDEMDLRYHDAST